MPEGMDIPMGRVAVVVSVLLAFGNLTCTLEPLDGRARDSYQAFAEEVFLIIRREVELSGPPEQVPPRLEFLEQKADDLKAGLRLVVQGRVETEMRPLLESSAFLDLYDDGTVGTLVQGGAELLQKLAADHDEARDIRSALARVGEAPGGTEPQPTYRFLRRFLWGAPDLVAPMARMVREHGETVGEVLALFWEQWGAMDRSGREPNGDRDGGKIPLWKQLTGHACAGLAPLDASRCVAALEFLGLGMPALSVRVDSYGNPQVQALPDGRFPAPFVDGSRDGLPDRDSRGRPIDQYGRPIDLPPFANTPVGPEDRAVDGRAMVPGTDRPIYRYMDAKHSVAGLLVWFGGQMVQEGWHQDLLQLGRSLAMGQAREPAVHSGPRAHEDPLILDLLWMLFEIRTYDRLPQLLYALSELISKNPQVMDRMVREMGGAATILEEERLRIGTYLTPGHTLIDDLIGDNRFRHFEIGKPCKLGVWPDPCNAEWLQCSMVGGAGRCAKVKAVPSIFEEMASSGIIRRLFATFSGPEHASWSLLAEATAVMMEHAVQDLSAVDLDRGTCPDYLEPGAAMPHQMRDRNLLPFTVRTDWLADDNPAQPANEVHRSMFQKLTHLFYDTNRAYWDPNIGGAVNPGIMPIKSLAALYVDSVASNLRLRLLGNAPDTVAISQVVCELTLDDDPHSGLPGADNDPLTPHAAQLDLFMMRNHHHPQASLPLRWILDIGNPRGNQGVDAKDLYGHTLVASQASRLTDSLRPLITIFSTHGPQLSTPRLLGEPGGRTNLFLDLMSTIHTHYGAYQIHMEQGPVQPDRNDDPNRRVIRDLSYGTGFRRLEPMFIRLARETDTFEAVFDILRAMDRTQLCLVPLDAQGQCPPPAGNRLNVADEVVAFSLWLLRRDVPVCAQNDRECLDEAKVYRSRGAEQPWIGSSTPIRRGDGSFQPSHELRPSRLHLVLDTLRRLDAHLHLPEHQDARESWDRLDLVGWASRPDLETGKLQHGPALHLLRHVLWFLGDTVHASMPEAGTEGDWNGYLDRLERQFAQTRDLVSSRKFDALLELVHVFLTDEGGLDPALSSDHVPFADWIYSSLSLATQFSEEPHHDVAGALSQTLMHLMQFHLDQEDLVTLVGTGAYVFQPGTDLLERVILAAHEMAEVDSGKMLNAFSVNLLEEAKDRPNTVVPLDVFGDLILGLGRRDPSQRGSYAPEDYLKVMQTVRDFLLDEHHGVGRMIDVVVGRLGD